VTLKAAHQNLVHVLKRSVAVLGVRESAAEILVAHSQEAHPSND
jgi:lysine/ornithine N-monooxygenase